MIVIRNCRDYLGPAASGGPLTGAMVGEQMGLCQGGWCRAGAGTSRQVHLLHAPALGFSLVTCR